MDVLFHFECRSETISGDNVGMRASLIGVEGDALWTSLESYTFVRERGREHTIVVPEGLNALYLKVGIYDLEDGYPLTVYLNGVLIATFAYPGGDVWQEATYELPYVPPTTGETMSSVIGAIMPILVLSMVMPMLGDVGVG